MFDEASSPVTLIRTDQIGEGPEEGVALCLSGGGYRAMLFHVGALWRLNELGYLPKLDRVSSVSGGSITAGVLVLAWNRLNFKGGVADSFRGEVVRPIRKLADTTIDIPAVLLGLLLPGSVNDRIVGAYRRHLYGSSTLQDLPDRPRFVINASNLQSGAVWRFSKPYMQDYRVGKISNPTVELAVAVGASSAFPPFLSPVILRFDESEYTDVPDVDLHSQPFTTKVYLSDGGVYDNLGLETAWKRYRTVLVSDGGVDGFRLRKSQARIGQGTSFACSPWLTTRFGLGARYRFFNPSGLVRTTATTAGVHTGALGPRYANMDYQTCWRALPK